MFKKYFLTLFLIVFPKIYGQTTPFKTVEKWVLNQLARMSLDEKIGQLFMIDAKGNKNEQQRQKIKKWVVEKHIGGVCFFKGNPVDQLSITRELQALSKTPILIGIDAEWGLAMRLEKTVKYPWNMTLGAVQNDTLITQMGARIAHHCKRLGVHINFAPVVDVNNNPENPIIGSRSFGENPVRVAQKAMALIKGMQAQNILVSLKHFPGHGDTKTDSHKKMPRLPFKKTRLEKIELYPYKKLFSTAQKPIDAVMVGHLNVPALTGDDTPSSLSYEVCTNLLQKKMGFKGLIITDGLNMAGAYQKKGADGSVSLKAFLAGNDILLLPKNFEKAFQTVKKAVKKGTVSMERLHHSVAKILRVKYRLKLFTQKQPTVENLITELNTRADTVLKIRLMKNALTLVKNEQILPLQNLDKKRIAYIKMGDAKNDHFIKTLKKYVPIKIINASKTVNILKQLQKEKINRVIVGYHRSDATPWKSYQFSKRQLKKIKAVSHRFPTVLTVFASPYSLSPCLYFKDTKAILLAYQNNKDAQRIATKMIFGAVVPIGVLPVSVGLCFEEGEGVTFTPLFTPLKINIHRWAFPEKKQCIEFNILEIVRKSLESSSKTGG